uniref:Uncharacterized protein n=1 Tax=Oryza glumipatula TaxID=40148 RepID=A0A0E0BQY8_9ORYZ
MSIFENWAGKSRRLTKSPQAPRCRLVYKVKFALPKYDCKDEGISEEVAPAYRNGGRARRGCSTDLRPLYKASTLDYATVPICLELRGLGASSINAYAEHPWSYPRR